jgi:para-nitrobenzyl esterase
VNTRFGVLISAKDQDFYDANSDYMSRVWRIRSVDGPAAALAAAGHADVYAYRFDWDDGGKFLSTDTGKLLGAAHAMEIPFVFDRFRLFGSLDNAVFAKATLADRQALADQMGAYWANFARSGVPSAQGAPDWPKWSENGGTLMRLDTKAGGGSGPISGVDTMERLAADLKADARLDDAERCLIAKGAAEWNPGVSAALVAGLGGC